jgi:hypothetical protein
MNNKKYGKKKWGQGKRRLKKLYQTTLYHPSMCIENQKQQ